MPEFYKLKEEKVIITVTDIPESMWERKGLLPYKHTIARFPEGATPDVIEGLTISDTQVEEICIQFYHEPTLQETKDSKIADLKLYMESRFPLLFKQINVVLGISSAAEKVELTKIIRDNIDYINGFELQINEALTISEVTAISFLIGDGEVVL